MTRLLASSVAVLVVSTGCSSAATVDESAGTSTLENNTTAASTVADEATDQPIEPRENDPVQNSTATTVVTSESTTRATGPTGTAGSRSTITTDAGRIEAAYRDGELDVDVDSNPGWTVDVQRRGPVDVDVVWTADGASVHATVVATDRGISATTRSVRSST